MAKDRSPGTTGHYRGPRPPLTYCSGRYCPLVVPHITGTSWQWEGLSINTIYTSKHKVSQMNCSLASSEYLQLQFQQILGLFPSRIYFCSCRRRRYGAPGSEVRRRRERSRGVRLRPRSVDARPESAPQCGRDAPPGERVFVSARVRVPKIA